MEISGNRWFSELGVDDSRLIYEGDMSSFNQFAPQVAPALAGGFQQSLSSESYTSHPSFHPVVGAPQKGFIEGPKKMQKINSWSPHNTEKNAAFGLDAPSPDSLSFHNPNSPNKTVSMRAAASQEEMRALVSHGSAQNYETITQQVSKTTKMGPVLSQAQDHIIAERKRREKLGQRFIALSAVIPRLKKKDKASVLGDAVEYIKELKERVKTLEDQNATRTVESMVLVKKSKLSVDDDGSSSNEFSNGCSSEESLPEIEVMLSEKTALMKIHCENRRGVLGRLLSEIEKVHLTVTNANIMPFLSSSIFITVAAKVEGEFSITLEDLARKLNSALS
ncbi:transcription factor bHLH18-like [Phoenix dactylifera]|uniref:Transcription factor bHLH18-like n=1 Tax=Phoenix dactylifera TaxID=42345 RepID=A0A8B8ZEB5_PHODC|nr:transcription factor bHLH18-like [Phoenix dactylifera]XP_017697826.1 transcription factor bHLH18-like [Phoenix dactylifera]XP_038971636.1 transcription factor bHLH18-like [Phoenix dactylifera]XP_038971637.1 transcription factor bHLH18-like [Phoenix dactylifera]